MKNFNAIIKRINEIENAQSPFQYYTIQAYPYWRHEEEVTGLRFNGQDLDKEAFNQLIKTSPINHIFYVLRGNVVVDTLRGGDI